MEQQLFIRVKTEKSNRSENMVWVVSTHSHKRKFCRNASMALRYAFFLKKATGRRIDDDSFNRMLSEIHKQQFTSQESVPQG